MATILVVPGIGGCELYTPPALFGLGPHLRVWLEYAFLPFGGWRAMALGPDGITPIIPLLGPLVPAGPLVYYYGQLIDRMGMMGHRMLGSRLDWRGTIARDAARLVDQIRSFESHGPICLLGHSRGGLVMREALHLLAATGELGRIGRCAGLGVPHQGSWEAVGLLAGWNQTVQLLNLFLRATTNPTAGGGPPGAVHDVVITWPGAYELMPQPGADGEAPSVVDLVYEPGTWEASGWPVLEPWLEAAKDRWSGWQPAPAGVEWVDVVGIGVSTPQHLLHPTQLGSPSSWTWSIAGDGYVPTRWATQPGRVQVTTPTSHGMMIYDGRLMAVLDGYFRHGLTEDVTIGGSVLR